MRVWNRISGMLGIGCGCAGAPQRERNGMRKIVLVGSPNMGKSVIFNNLTGAHSTVSNYPGTTVDVARGKARIDGEDYEVIDTPGMYSLSPITEEERVARSILFSEKPELVVHVADAKNLPRMLPLTLQLVETGIPVILDLNMMDEAKTAGVGIDIGRLERELGIPILPTIAITGQGMEEMRSKIADYAVRRCAAKI